MQTPRAARPLFWAFFAASHIILWVGILQPLHAQQSPLTTWVGGGFPVVMVHPTVPNDGARIDCAPGTPGCKPLNLARCTDPTPLPIDFIISSGGGTTVPYTGQSQVLYAFLGTTVGCIYSTVTGQTGNNPNLLIGTTSSLAGSAPFFTGGTVPFRFPQGVSTFNAGMTQAGTTGVFTVGEMMQALNVCPPNAPVQMSTYSVCVGVDATNSQGIGNSSTTAAATSTTPGTTATSGQDPVSYLQFQIDTQPPAAPTISGIKNLNGRCKLDVTYDTSSLDVYSINVRYTHDPQNLGRPCDAWTGDVGTSTQFVYRQTASTSNFVIDHLANDESYAFCAESIDYSENVSAPSEVAMGSPRYECDLFGCYPDELQTGFCAQAAGPQLWLASLAAVCARLSHSAWRRRSGRAGPRSNRLRRGCL